MDRAGARGADRDDLARRGRVLAEVGAVAPLLEEEFLLAEGRFQMIEPGRIGVEFRIKRLAHPVWIAGLQELQREDFFAMDVGDAVDDDLAGEGAHRRPAHGARQAGHHLVRGLEDLVRARQRQLEIFVRAGVALAILRVR